jgi:hypothetical protein
VDDADNDIFEAIVEPTDGEGVGICDKLEALVGKEFPSDEVSIANGTLVYGCGCDCGNIGKLSASEVVKAADEDEEETNTIGEFVDEDNNEEETDDDEEETDDDDHSDMDVIVGTIAGWDDESNCLIVGSTTNVAD